MFTFRLEWTRGGKREHSMHQAEEYQVQHEGADDTAGIGARKVITLNPDSDTPKQLILDGKTQVVYVMNDAGQTVDRIRRDE